MDSEDQQPESRSDFDEEFEDYLKKTCLIDSFRAVIRVLYEIDERPEDPLEFMRANMNDIIIERDEFKDLQEENILLRTIIKLQYELIKAENKPKELELQQENASQD